MNSNMVKSAFNKVAFALRKNAPEIMVVGGVIGGVASAVLACKATTKAQLVLEEAKTQIDTIHEVAENPDYKENYSEEDNKKDLAIVYVQTGVKLVKTYAPAIGLGVLSITSILGGHNILRKRNVALAAAYTTIDKAFKDYRENVVKRFGESVDKQLRYNLKAETITEKVEDPETGKKKSVKKEILIPEGDGVYSGYARMFDRGCDPWENDASLNRAFLMAQEEYANQKLRTQGYLFLSDVYKVLGFRDDRASHCVGWVFDENTPKGDNYVSFGFRDNLDFMSGHEASTILDFNVDGPILDTFEDCYKGNCVC